jgi:hypothetical protein
MNTFNTIHDLVSHTKKRIDDLHIIVDVLLSNYKTGADSICELDMRTKPLNALQELNSTLSDLVDTHPAFTNQKIELDVAYKITQLAKSTENTMSKF